MRNNASLSFTPSTLSSVLLNGIAIELYLGPDHCVRLFIKVLSIMFKRGVEATSSTATLLVGVL